MQEIFLKFIVPVLVVVGISGIIAFALSYLGEKMAVVRDPRIDDVSRLLAGVNCGGCGYAGCDAFAEALVAGKAKISDCNPTSTLNKKNIAKVLNLTDNSKPTFAVVHCLGGNKCKSKFDYQGYGDCQSAEILAGGNKACYVGCMGLGTCMKVCKFHAINVGEDTAVAVTDDKLCTSCGACVSNCPKKIISRIPHDAKVYVGCSNTSKGKEIIPICEMGCIACGKCVKACPVNCMNLNNNLAMIDYDKCIGCGKCAEVCPRHCIVKREPTIAVE